MLSVAICDDEPAVCREIEELLAGQLVRADLDGNTRVFSDGEKLSKLESMVHPAVKEDFENWKASHEGRNIPFVIMESAIILDRPLFRDTADMVLVVEAPLETRIGRTERRDGTDRGKVMARISAQKTPDSGKLVRRDSVYSLDGAAWERSIFRQAAR